MDPSILRFAQMAGIFGMTVRRRGPSCPEPQRSISKLLDERSKQPTSLPR